MTLLEFSTELQKVREAIKQITVKGYENASLIVYAVDRCTALIQMIDEVMQLRENNQNGNHEESEKGGDIDGQSDRGAAS